MNAEQRAADLRYRTTWLLLGWLLIALVIYLSLTSEPGPSFLRFVGADKLEHVMAYATLMGWFCQLFWHGRQRAMLGAAFVAMGIALEFVQGAIGYRQFDYSDMIADAAGVAIGWLSMATRLRETLAVLDRLAGVVAQR